MVRVDLIKMIFNKKTGLFVLILILFSSFVYADDCSIDPADYVVYDDFENGVLNTTIWTDVASSYLVTAGASANGSFGLGLNTSIASDRDIAMRTFNLNNRTTDTFTVEFFAKFPATAQHKVFATGDSASAGHFLYFGAPPDIYTYETGFSQKDSGINYASGQWYHVKYNVTKSSEDTRLEVNDVYYSGADNADVPGAPSNWYFYLSGGGAVNSQILFDDLRIYNGSTCPAGTPVSSATLTNISTFDLYDFSAVLSFTAVVYNSTNSYTITTTNGSALFRNLSGLFTVNISATNYFNRSYTSFNSTNDLQTYIYQAVLNVNSSEFITNNSLSIFNATVGTQYNETTTGLTTFYLKAGTYDITIDKAGYYNSSKSVTISALTNTTQTVLNLYDTLLNISAQDLAGTGINIFTLNLTSLNNSYSVSQSTTNGTVYFPLITGTYNLTIDPVNSTIKYNTTRVNSTGKITSWLYTFSVAKMNSILFNIYDEITGNLINQSVTIELISDLFANNYTTANGTKYISLLTPENYTIRYSSTNYYTRTYYFNLLNRTINSLNLYLVNTSVATEVTATVLDASNFPVEDAYIKVLKYDLATNSYIIREIVKTNFEGEGLAHIVLTDELYKFIIDYQDVTKLTTTPTQIYENSISFQISLTAGVGANYYTTAGIDYTLTFNNNTHTYTYTYNDRTNTIGGGCLKIYDITHLGETKINDTCIESSSGSISITVLNETGKKYKAVSYVHFSDYYFIDSLYKTYEEIFNDEKDLRLFLLIIIQLVIVFVSAWDLVVMFIMLPIPATIGYITGLISIPLGILIAFWFAVLFLAFVISERN